MRDTLKSWILCTCKLWTYSAEVDTSADWNSGLLLSHSEPEYLSNSYSFALCSNDTATDTALLHYLGLYLDVHITTFICTMWGNSTRFHSPCQKLNVLLHRWLWTLWIYIIFKPEWNAGSFWYDLQLRKWNIFRFMSVHNIAASSFPCYRARQHHRLRATLITQFYDTFVCSCDSVALRWVVICVCVSFRQPSVS